MARFPKFKFDTKMVPPTTHYLSRGQIEQLRVEYEALVKTINLSRGGRGHVTKESWARHILAEKYGLTPQAIRYWTDPAFHAHAYQLRGRNPPPSTTVDIPTFSNPILAPTASFSWLGDLAE